tara:strand:- start:803 stop:1414 length:612 start_codon:yes stop_codon:yes gene_type:complete
MEEFYKYPIIKSKTSDNMFFGSSSRGDGYCSIWSIIIGKSLIDENIFKFDWQNLQIKSISDIINNILSITNSFIEIIKEQGKDSFDINDSININIFELEFLKKQLEKPFENISTIEGVAHIKILSFVMHVNIQLEDTVLNKLYSFNYEYLPSIRISTNNSHYHVRNSSQTNQINFKNNFWWDHMWTWIPYPPISEGIKLIPFI